MIQQKSGYNKLSEFLSSNHSQHLELELSFRNNDNRNGSLNGLIQALKDCNNVKSLTLDLYNSNIDDRYLDNLGKALIYSSNLESLTLSIFHNKIGDQGLCDFSTSLGNHKNLKTLNLLLGDQKQSDITSKGTSELARAIAKCINITSLNLEFYYDFLCDEGLSGLVPAFTQNILSLVLSLQLNQISNEGMKNLSKGLVNCIHLTSLFIDFSRNKIGDDGLYAFSDALSNMENIISLFLALPDNEIDYPGLNYFGKSLFKCQRLRSLILDIKDSNIDIRGSFVFKKITQLVLQKIILSSGRDDLSGPP